MTQAKSSNTKRPKKPVGGTTPRKVTRTAAAKPVVADLPDDDDYFEDLPDEDANLGTFPVHIHDLTRLQAASKSEPPEPSHYNPRRLRLAPLVASLRQMAAGGAQGTGGDAADGPFNVLWPPQARENMRRLYDAGLIDPGFPPAFHPPVDMALDMVFSPYVALDEDPDLAMRGIRLSEEEVLARDRRIAEAIRAMPDAILLSPVAQDAICRWTYGAYHLPAVSAKGTAKSKTKSGKKKAKPGDADPAPDNIQARAKEFLDIASGRDGGRPVVFRGGGPGLLSTLSDLEEYAKRLCILVRECNKWGVTGLEYLVAPFPDYAKLEEIGIDVTGAIEKDLPLPTWGEIAEKVFMSVVPMGRSQFYALKKAAKEEAKENPAPDVKPATKQKAKVMPVPDAKPTAKQKAKKKAKRRKP